MDGGSSCPFLPPEFTWKSCSNLQEVDEKGGGREGRRRGQVNAGAIQLARAMTRVGIGRETVSRIYV